MAKVVQSVVTSVHFAQKSRIEVWYLASFDRIKKTNSNKYIKSIGIIEFIFMFVSKSFFILLIQKD